MIIENVNSEHPQLHWKYIKCKNKIVADLGCGRWEKYEYREKSWPTTPEYLIQMGAEKVFAYDIDPEEIAWYNTEVAPKMAVFPKLKGIYCVDDLREVLKESAATVIKCDIESEEKQFFSLSREEFRAIEFFAIETHTNALNNTFREVFDKFNYNVIANVNLTHVQQTRVIYAERID